jgi:CheY-like chemotaxis protein
MQYKILVVDNDLRSRKNVCQLLGEEGYDVDEADDGHTALARLEAGRFDLLICDVVMPRMNAFDVIKEMHSRSLSIPVILITAHPEALAATGLRDLPYFTKPFNLYDLLHKTRQLLGEELPKPKPA